MSIWRLLERPALRPVWTRVHDALERNADAKSVLLHNLERETRSDLQGLLGLSARPPDQYRLRLSDVDGAVGRAERGLTCRLLVERIVGPITDRRARRAARTAADLRMWDEARAAAPESLHPWLEYLRSTGKLRAAATKTGRPIDAVLCDALACASALPANGKLLQVLASEKVGDPHALDGTRNLASLVLRAAASLVGWDGWPRSAAERRALWAEVGVLTESQSSHVLVHGLRPLGEGPLATALSEQSERGLPRKITLAELAAERIRLPAGTIVYLTENPSVVDEAARRHGAACAPVVCLEGEPTVAVWKLLRGLSHHCLLVFHCDFDPAGVRIANRIYHRAGGRPWAFDRVHYDRAVARKGATTPIEGRVTHTPWDPALAQRMREVGIVVSEEDVIDELVWDLGRTRPPEEPDPDVPF